jgi:hypothetical protein
MKTFKELKAQVELGQKMPTVSVNKGNVSFLGYQLAVHVYALGIMSLGMTYPGVTFKEIKAYYELKGRSAKDCLPQLKIILSDFKTLA